MVITKNSGRTTFSVQPANQRLTDGFFDAHRCPAPILRGAIAAQIPQLREPKDYFKGTIPTSTFGSARPL